ncbi:MAG: TPM domain-containing protein [Pseudomonadota bacterium]
MKAIYRFLLISYVTFFMSLGALAQSLPDHRSTFVNDFANVLAPSTEMQIRALLAEALSERDHEMTVVTINSRNDYGSFANIESFAKSLFNYWQVGKAQRNDGVLLVVAVKDRDIRIALGAGYEARWDGVAKRIIDRDMIRLLSAGAYDSAILAGTRESLKAFDLAKALPKNGPQPERAPNHGPGAVDQLTDWLSENAQTVFFVMFGLVFLGSNKISIRKLLAKLPLFLTLYDLRQNVLLRVWPRKCPKCRQKMRKLGQAQGSQYLSKGQKLEQKLGAKNYGIWFCDHDEHVEILGFGAFGVRHTDCPNCEHKTNLEQTTVLESASHVKNGLNRVDSQCAYCGHRQTREILTPILVRSNKNYFGSGGSGRGGGSSGFGGGSSSGGGGSGRF